jgi:hypothetical protein
MTTELQNRGLQVDAPFTLPHHSRPLTRRVLPGLFSPPPSSPPSPTEDDPRISTILNIMPPNHLHCGTYLACGSAGVMPSGTITCKGGVK